MMADASDYLDQIVFAVGLADIRNVIKLIDNDLLVLVQEIEDVVIVIIERVAVYAGYVAKFSNRDIGQLLCL